MTTHRLTADRRRSQLIAATISSVARHGLEGCSIHAITKAAGVSRGLIHHYYESKDELLSAAYAHLGSTMMREIRRIAEDGSRPAMERLRDVIRGLFVPPVSSATNVSAWLGFWHAARRLAPLRAINRSIYADYRVLMRHLVSDAAAERGRELDVEEVVSTLIALNDGSWIELAIDPGSAPSAASSMAYVRLVLGD